MKSLRVDPRASRSAREWGQSSIQGRAALERVFEHSLRPFESILSRGRWAPDVLLSPHANPIRFTREALDASRDSAQIVVYKFEERSLRKALRRALDRGVRMQLLADADAARGANSFVSTVWKAGAEVRLWTQGKLHAKFAILDRSRVISGSFNWTDSARCENLELLLEFGDPPTTARFESLFDELWSRAEPFA